MSNGLPEKKRDKIIDDILKVVRKNRTFLLSGHEKPDGDTIGSELAFASFLRRLKKKVDIINAEPVPQYLQFLPGAGAAKAAKKAEGRWDVVVVFECSGPERMGNIVDLKTQAGTVINIDHHAHHNYFGHINLINPKASSNSEQLFYVFKRAKMAITKDEAEALYVGLVTDTGRFQQENTNTLSHEVASGLHAAGINVAEITRRVYNTRTETSLKLLGRALSSLRLEAGGRIAVMSVSQADFAATGSNPEETEDVINHGLMVPTVQVALFLRDTDKPDDVKVSFRGKGQVDLCKIAVSFGGGGHKNASGCNIPGALPEVTRRVLAEVEKALPSLSSPSR